jgi:hypothetical protein
MYANAYTIPDESIIGMGGGGGLKYDTFDIL